MPEWAGFLIWRFYRNIKKKGIGKMLLKFIEEEARKEGYKILGCMSRLNTTDFFEEAGYRVEGLPTHFIGTTQVVWMEKTL